MLSEPRFFEEFCIAFAHSGSIVIQCKCGRLHVAIDEIGFLEGEEIAEIHKLENNDPDSVIRWNCSSISWTTINNEQVVFNCPCGYAEELCCFIENHHPDIMRVIGKIVEFEKNEIKIKEELFQKAKGVE